MGIRFQMEMGHVRNTVPVVTGLSPVTDSHEADCADMDMAN
jgi:hypothetical protein